jgi:hypothetical protein
MASPPVFTIESWRIRTDTNSADGGIATWASDEDQAANVDIANDSTFRIRFVVENASGNLANNEDLSLEWRVDTGGGYGSWAEISATADSTTDPVAGSSSASSSADNTTIATGNFELTAAAGTAQAGKYWDDTAVPTGNCDVPDNGNYTEFEFGLAFNSTATTPASVGDLFQFRITLDNSPETANYTNVPTVEVQGVVSPGAGSADGDSVLSATGQSLAESDGSADGDSTVSGAGGVAISAAGSADGDSTLSGVGVTAFPSDGSAAGDSSLSASASSLFSVAGSPVGDSTLTASGSSLSEAPASLVGDSTLTVTPPVAWTPPPMALPMARRYSLA